MSTATTGTRKRAARRLLQSRITGGAKTEMAATPLLTNLAFHFAPTFDLARSDSEVVSPRSRGPPTL
jgi:hypothetical protein